MIYLMRHGQTDWNRGTEPFEDFKKRTCEFCDMLVTNYEGKDVLIITHAANVRVINYYFTGKSEAYNFCKPIGRNGEVVILEN